MKGGGRGGRKLYSAMLCKYTLSIEERLQKQYLKYEPCLLLYCTELSPYRIMIII